MALIPEDYFLSAERRPSPWENVPSLKLCPLFAKIFCICVAIRGLLMLFVPGQGLLTMVAGLLTTLANLLRKKIVKNPSILRA